MIEVARRFGAVSAVIACSLGATACMGESPALPENDSTSSVPYDVQVPVQTICPALIAMGEALGPVGSETFEFAFKNVDGRYAVTQIEDVFMAADEPLRRLEDAIQTDVTVTENLRQAATTAVSKTKHARNAYVVAVGDTLKRVPVLGEETVVRMLSGAGAAKFDADYDLTAQTDVARKTTLGTYRRYCLQP